MLKQRPNLWQIVAFLRFKTLYWSPHLTLLKVCYLEHSFFTGLAFITDGVNKEIPSNQRLSEQLLNGVITVDFDVRGCVAGEQMLTNGKCKECPSGSYILSIPFEPVSCSNCKTDVSYCLGGTKVFPKPGYWRSSNATDNFLECINYDACLGGIA